MILLKRRKKNGLIAKFYEILKNMNSNIIKLLLTTHLVSCTSLVINKMRENQEIIENANYISNPTIFTNDLLENLIPQVTDTETNENLQNSVSEEIKTNTGELPQNIAAPEKTELDEEEDINQKSLERKIETEKENKIDEQFIFNQLNHLLENRIANPYRRNNYQNEEIDLDSTFNIMLEERIEIEKANKRILFRQKKPIKLLNNNHTMEINYVEYLDEKQMSFCCKCILFILCFPCIIILLPIYCCFIFCYGLKKGR